MSARLVHRLAAFDHSRVLLPWFTHARGARPVDRLRRFAHRLEYGARAAAPGLGLLLLAALCYLPSSLRQACIAWHRESLAVRRHYGVSRRRQFGDLVRLAWQGNLHPDIYYYQRLFRHGDRDDALAVVPHRELEQLLPALHAQADTRVLKDKVAFHAFCVQHDLPCAPVLAVFADGAADPACTAAEGPAWERDLFVKPSRGYSSHDVQAWNFDPAAATWSRGAQTLSRPELLAALAHASRRSALVVQPRLRNHPGLAPLSSQALANIRLVTARQPDGAIAPLLAVLRMGRGDAITSDEPVHAFSAAIDLASGRLHAGESKQASEGSLDRHPDSGATITGAVVPLWPECLALARRAHTLLPGLAFVGWDVIVTDTGAGLLEGNLVWGGNLAQMSGNPPLGLTDFPSLYLHHLGRLRPELQPLAS